MTLPIWMLLGFAAWTLLLLMVTVGIYRWGRILAGLSGIASFRSDQLEGAPWYQRGTRAHANCIENLPVFGAIVIALQAGHVTGSLVNWLSIAILAARVVQSLLHVCFIQTDKAVAFRFSFYSVQLISFIWLISIVVLRFNAGT